jgi:predicted RNA polymerase sigma factor
MSRTRPRLRLTPESAPNPLDADERLAGHHRLDAVRAHLLELAGDPQAAIAHYRRAAGRTASLPERNYLMTQAARLGEAGR